MDNKRTLLNEPPPAKLRLSPNTPASNTPRRCPLYEGIYDFGCLDDHRAPSSISIHAHLKHRHADATQAKWNLQQHTHPTYGPLGPTYSIKGCPTGRVVPQARLTLTAGSGGCPQGCRTGSAEREGAGERGFVDGWTADRVGMWRGGGRAAMEGATEGPFVDGWPGGRIGARRGGAPSEVSEVLRIDKYTGQRFHRHTHSAIHCPISPYASMLIVCMSVQIT